VIIELVNGSKKVQWLIIINLYILLGKNNILHALLFFFAYNFSFYQQTKINWTWKTMTCAAHSRKLHCGLKT